MEKKKPQGLPLKDSAVITLILVVLIVIYSTVCSKFGVLNGWAGTLFLWYWSSVKKFDPTQILSSAAGGLVGVLCAWGLYLVLHNAGLGTFHMVEPLVLFVVILLCCWEPLPLFFNGATFLYITVLTAIVFLAGETNYPEVILSFAVGTAYFGGLMTLALKLLTRPKKDGAQLPT